REPPARRRWPAAGLDRQGFYPLVHNTHDSGILKLSVASSGHPLQALAEDYVGRVLARLDYVGVLAFEFFEVDGGLKANEIAPRVHN
ncbi:ATP-grasp domain-containing protein, partial [Listeria monocytogenes]|nr:ATP-grasp domain-containing protein [Listeria monocytogenes]